MSDPPSSALPEPSVAIDPDRIAAVFVRLAIVIVAVGTAVAIVRLRLDGPFDVADLGARFELHTDQSLPTWFAAITLMCSVPPLWLVARSAEHGTGDRVRWLGLTGLVAVFSLDEVATFHEYASAIIDVEILGFVGGYNWVVLGAVFVVVLVATYAPFLLRLPAKLRRRLVLVAILYFGGALGVEMVNAHTASTIGDQNLRYLLGTTVEESLELAGAILLLHTMLDHLRERGSSVLVTFTASSPR